MSINNNNNSNNYNKNKASILMKPLGMMIMMTDTVAQWLSQSSLEYKFLLHCFQLILSILICKMEMLVVQVLFTGDLFMNIFPVERLLIGFQYLNFVLSFWLMFIQKYKYIFVTKSPVTFQMQLVWMSELPVDVLQNDHLGGCRH